MNDIQYNERNKAFVKFCQENGIKDTSDINGLSSQEFIIFCAGYAANKSDYHENAEKIKKELKETKYRLEMQEALHNHSMRSYEALEREFNRVKTNYKKASSDRRALRLKLHAMEAIKETKDGINMVLSGE